MGLFVAALPAIACFAIPAANLHAADRPAELQAMKQLEQASKNKALVRKAYQELFGDHELTAIDRYWGEPYIQHSPYFTDGRDALKQSLEKLGIASWPKQKLEFKRVLADGDLVMIQTVQPKMANSPEIVIIDIFRIEGGKIVENWDVMQPVPENAPNKRPMY
jgi:predicted SnoaL-like aldol condensation-catalyzing enzyme